MELSDVIAGRYTFGHGLTPEEAACLETQFALVARNERLGGHGGLRLWGRVCGTGGDYLLAYALAPRAEVPSKLFYYCTTAGEGALTLVRLPDCLPEHAAKAAAVGNGRFLGSPAKLLGANAVATEEEEAEEEPEEEQEQPVPEEGAEAPAEEGSEAGGEGSDATAPAAAAGSRYRKPRPVRFTEAHRLAWTVKAIDDACALVPAGALVMTPHRAVALNPSFAGLPPSLVGSLAHLLHFRPPTAEHRLAALARGGLLSAAAGASDAWLDPASEDDPPAALVWAVRKAAAPGGGGGTLLLSARSLLWPGYAFWHEVGTPAYGGLYVGDGVRNDDLCFCV